MNTIAQSKYFRLIKTFTLEDQKSYESWLNSPWCNTNKNLITLFEKVKKYYPNFDDPKLTKEKLFKKILPNGKYSDRRMNNILSEGYLAAERFIVFQNLAKDQNLQKDLLTKEFQSRHLEDWFFRDINKEIERVEEIEIKEWEDHLHLFQMHRRVYHHPNQKRLIQTGKNSIIKMGDNLTVAFIIEKAAIINEKIFRNKILQNEKHEVKKDIENWINLSLGYKNTSIELYQKRFEYNEKNMLEKYFEIRNLFLDRYNELNEKDQKMHFFYLLNDTTILGKARYVDITESLPLYKLGLKAGILFSEGKLTQTTYMNILMSSNAKKDFEFSNYFIETFTKKLKDDIQLDAFFWAKSHTCYRMLQLQESLDYLLNHAFKTPRFLLLTKSLTTQVYFDLYLVNESYQTFLFNYFDSFEKWIYREKFGSDKFKKGFLNFVQALRKLAKHYSDANFNNDKVKNLLSDYKNVQGAKWLSQRIDKVIKIRNGNHS